MLRNPLILNVVFCHLKRAGALHQRGIPETLAIVSDDAGQFDVLTHGLCWVHAERLIHKLIPLNEQHREDQQAIRAQIWDFYADLKKYQQAPSAEKKAELNIHHRQDAYTAAL